MLDLSFPCPMRRLLTVVRGEGFAFSGVSYCDPSDHCVFMRLDLGNLVNKSATQFNKRVSYLVELNS